jgi:hypothetical protein
MLSNTKSMMAGLRSWLQHSFETQTQPALVAEKELPDAQSQSQSEYSFDCSEDGCHATIHIVVPDSDSPLNTILTKGWTTDAEISSFTCPEHSRVLGPLLIGVDIAYDPEDPAMRYLTKSGGKKLIEAFVAMTRGASSDEGGSDNERTASAS